VKILVTGCNGQVGWELVRCLQPLGDVIAADRRQMDLSDLDSIKSTLSNIVPDVIVNAAAYTAVDNATPKTMKSRPILSMDKHRACLQKRPRTLAHC